MNIPKLQNQQDSNFFPKKFTESERKVIYLSLKLITNRGLIGDWMLQVCDKSLKFDVFISYSSRDKLIIAALIEDLKRENITYWFDVEQIDFGDSINEKNTE